MEPDDTIEQLIKWTEKNITPLTDEEKAELRHKLVDLATQEYEAGQLELLNEDRPDIE